MKGEKRKVSLEDYVDFFNRKTEQLLSVDQLKQITLINGFRKPERCNKSTLLDLLPTVDLTPPSRSTLGECHLRMPACAGLSLDEAVKDIAELGWQECPIGSVLIMGNTGAVEPISFSRGGGQGKKKGESGGSNGRGMKRKQKLQAELLNLPSIGSWE